MKALTLWPEWVWAILHLGKRIENRIWTPSARELAPGAWFALHAGVSIGGRKGKPATVEGLESVAGMALRAGFACKIGTLGASGIRGIAVNRPCLEGSTIYGSVEPFIYPNASLIQRGAIVAAVEYLGSSKDSDSPWAVPGSRHLQLGRVVVLDNPIPCLGSQKLWNITPEHQAILEEAINKSNKE